MPVYQPTPGVRSHSVMLPLSQVSTRTASLPPTLAPNMPQAPSLAQVAGGGLTATWTAPSVDTTHSAATGFNLQFSLSGANTWTVVSNVASPYTLAGLAAGTAFDVQVESLNAA